MLHGSGFKRKFLELKTNHYDFQTILDYSK